MKLFLSHSWSDKPLVQRVADDLKGARIDVWLDNEKIGPGASIPRAVSNGLHQGDYVLAFISSAFLKSEWAQWETNSAIASSIASGKIRLIPVLIQDVWNDVSPLLRDKRYIDLRAHSNLLLYRKALEEILALDGVPQDRQADGPPRKPVITVTGGRDTTPLQLEVADRLGEILGYEGYSLMTGVARGVDSQFASGVRRGHDRSGRYGRDLLTCWTNRGNNKIDVNYGRVLNSNLYRREEGIPELVRDADVGVFIGGGKNTQYLGVLMMLENRLVLPVGATQGAAADLADLLVVRATQGVPGLLPRIVYDHLRDQRSTGAELVDALMEAIRLFTR